MHIRQKFECIHFKSKWTNSEYCSSNDSEMDRDRSVGDLGPAKRDLPGILDQAGPGAAGRARKTGSIVSGMSNVRSLNIVKRTSKRHTHTHVPHSIPRARAYNTRTYTHI